MFLWTVTNLSTIFKNQISTIFLGVANARIGLDKSDEIYLSMMFVLLLNVFNTITNFPFSIYSTFVLVNTRTNLEVVSRMLNLNVKQINAISLIQV